MRYMLLLLTCPKLPLPANFTCNTLFGCNFPTVRAGFLAPALFFPAPVFHLPASKKPRLKNSSGAPADGSSTEGLRPPLSQRSAPAAGGGPPVRPACPPGQPRERGGTALPTGPEGRGPGAEPPVPAPTSLGISSPRRYSRAARRAAEHHLSSALTAPESSSKG